MQTYEPPTITIIEVQIEQGFAGSLDGDIGGTDPMGGNGDVNVNW